jgi:hypothetical protein
LNEDLFVRRCSTVYAADHTLGFEHNLLTVICRFGTVVKPRITPSATFAFQSAPSTLRLLVADAIVLQGQSLKPMSKIQGPIGLAIQSKFLLKYVTFTMKKTCDN